MPVANNQLSILLVDDSKDDAFFITKAMERIGIGECVRHVQDGEEAIRYLRGENEYQDRNTYPFPTVILSDLNMPRMSGFELLRWLREHPECSVIPVILFSNSAVESDVREAYRLGANSYMVKPSNLAGLESLMRVACEYWNLCERPPAPQKC